MKRHGFAPTGCAALAVALSALLGCGNSGDGGGLTGRMELISQESVPLAPPNLLSNGGFEEWVAGAPAPGGFGAPSGRFSSLARGPKDAAEGELAARQTWKSGDGADSFWRQFHVVVKGITPGTPYRISVRAKNLSRNTVIIAASHIDMLAPPSPNGERRLAKIANVLQVDPTETFQEFTGSFTTHPAGSDQILLSVACLGDGNDFPATVVWDDWRLTEAVETTP
jgi:hypothetical protein